MEDKDKPLLSHTVSLPSPENSTNDTATPTPHRSKSVRQKTPNKVWSFGDMAKAVGCGVTAFGSNVVNSSMAVGSGVYHGSVAVGNNVVEGTKVAGRVTKDVTLAAGKGVVQAGELVGSAAVSTVQVGKVVTSASVSAVQDTTKWMIEQTELENQLVHVVLPGEDLTEISRTYRVPAHKLIKVNSLRQRKLIPGKEIIIPKKDSSEPVEHPMDCLLIKCNIDGSAEGISSISFAVKNIVLTRPGNEETISWKNVKSIIIEKLSEEDVEMPELLSVDDITDFGVILDDTTTEGTEEDVRLAILDQTDNIICKIKTNSNMLYQIYSHINLWYPEKIDSLSNSLISSSNREDAPFVYEDLICTSQILTKSLLEEIHTSLRKKTQSSKWSIMFSTVLDGYSLQNFYRKATLCNEPFLLVIQDENDEIFGAFLTCTPMMTEEFVGTGESWLFQVKENSIKVYEWSKENEYFFQGKSNCLIIGANDGKFGIFIDGNLHHGRIDYCGTFLDWPEEAKDFRIKCFECFNFD